MLRRFMNLGHPSRMLATADPETGDLLPADDTSWEQGVCTGFASIFRDLTNHSAFIIDQTVHLRFFVRIENGKVCTICASNVSLGASF